MRVVLANNKELEKHNIIEKIVRIFSVPLLNKIPSSIIKKILKKSSEDGKIAVTQGGSARAIEAMYTRYEHGLFSEGILQGIADLFWHNYLSQPKAIRNRLKIIEKILENEISEIFYKKKQKNINILTIAGGSARGIIETVCKFKNKNRNCNIKIISIDISKDAINLGKELAGKFNINSSFNWIKDDAKNIKKYIKSNSIDIVEAVGLLDYFSDEKGILIFSKIYDVLKGGGMFITANICPNEEAPFIRKIGWPNMYYRKPKDFAKIIEKSGFLLKRSKIILEPLKIHIIAVIKK